VIERGHLVHFPDRVIELFPNDADLPKLNAVSYAGAFRSWLVRILIEEALAIRQTGSRRLKGVVTVES
jgi:hypothetical protein